MTQPDIEVHDTAFVTCCYRASDETLSGDPYSKHWITEKAEEWVRTYTREVCPHEPFVHCLRNRFFLEQISAFFKEKPNGVLVNVGSGLSMYPYLLPSTHRYCDADLSEIVFLKRKKLQVWGREGKMPSRNISYIAVDFDDEVSRLHFEEQISIWLKGQASFILIEGVIFFLKEASVTSLFDLFSRLQRTGDRLGSVSFVPEIQQTAVYTRFLDYYERHLSQSRDKYTKIDNSFYEQLSGYNLLQHKDHCELSRRYVPERVLSNPKEILNEHMYILERT